MDEDDTKYDKANPNIRNKGPNHAWNVYKETWGDNSRFENIGKGGKNGKRKSNLTFWKLESQTHKEIKQGLAWLWKIYKYL